jgi:hypothetical protein
MFMFSLLPAPGARAHGYRAPGCGHGHAFGRQWHARGCENAREGAREYGCGHARESEHPFHADAHGHAYGYVHGHAGVCVQACLSRPGPP